MDDDKIEENGKDVRRGLAIGRRFAGRWVGCPRGREDACFDGGRYPRSVGFCVGFEELGI